MYQGHFASSLTHLLIAKYTPRPSSCDILLSYVPHCSWLVAQTKTARGWETAVGYTAILRCFRLVGATLVKKHTLIFLSTSLAQTGDWYWSEVYAFALTLICVWWFSGDFASFEASHVSYTRWCLGRRHLDNGQLLLPPTCNLPKTPDLYIQVKWFTVIM